MDKKNMRKFTVALPLVDPLKMLKYTKESALAALKDAGHEAVFDPKTGNINYVAVIPDEHFGAIHGGGRGLSMGYSVDTDMLSDMDRCIVHKGDNINDYELPDRITSLSDRVESIVGIARDNGLTLDMHAISQKYFLLAAERERKIRCDAPRKLKKQWSSAGEFVSRYSKAGRRQARNIKRQERHEL